jgi:hypothetical protein
MLTRRGLVGIQASNLSRRPKHPDYLAVMQKVPYTAQDHRHDNIEDAFADVLGP